MPSITLTYSSAGPLLQVMIGVSRPHADALTAVGRPVPPLVTGTFLIDTGASSTCVDPGLVAPLGLTQTGAVMIQTPSTNGVPVACAQYDVMMIIAGAVGTLPMVVEATPVMETSLRSQGIDGLLGRDVLGNCVLITNGPASLLTLSY